MWGADFVPSQYRLWNGCMCCEDHCGDICTEWGFFFRSIYPFDQQTNMHFVFVSVTLQNYDGQDQIHTQKRTWHNWIQNRRSFNRVYEQLVLWGRVIFLLVVSHLVRKLRAFHGARFIIVFTWAVKRLYPKSGPSPYILFLKIRFNIILSALLGICVLFSKLKFYMFILYAPWLLNDLIFHGVITVTILVKVQTLPNLRL